MKSYYVYILQCDDLYLYTGITNNISTKIIEHQEGLNISCFTDTKKPVELIFYQEFNDINQAISFEKEIKKWSRAKKLALANQDFDVLQFLSKCKNKIHSNNMGLNSTLPNTLNFDKIVASKNQEVHISILKNKNSRLFIKREDKIHPFVSGNKFRKLKYNIQQAQKQQQQTLLTFGGAFSNHIVATAVAGKIAGFKTIGIIRGEELANNFDKTLASNATLKEAHNNGMIFHFVTREAYRNKTKLSFMNALKNKFGNFYLVPEGGTNELAVKGCEEILTNDDDDFDYICVAVGTGGTISGLINSANKNQKVLGFLSLKGDFLADEIQPFINQKKNWSLINEYHFGGYAKYNLELITFINQFKKETNIQLDPIYTGKMLFGIVDLIKKNYFSENSKILAIHTGGIQGIEGFNQKLTKKNQQLIIV